MAMRDGGIQRGRLWRAVARLSAPLWPISLVTFLFGDKKVTSPPILSRKNRPWNLPQAAFFILEEQKRDPCNHIGAELEFQTQFFQQGHYVDAMAFHTGMHLFREPAGFTL